MSSVIADLVLQYGVSLQQYANDTQLYTVCSVDDVASALSTLESCLASLHFWLSHSDLALNPSKSEAIIFGTRQRLISFHRPSVIHITYSVHRCPSPITPPPSVSLWTQTSLQINAFHLCVNQL